ncbi:MAG TPA: DUF488 domain-containing protein [Bacteroidia bacterium]|nr:DUF488 domain-containing protein [Bacteroidia bacterium]
MIKLFTIGFTEKPAEKFFTLLKKAGVKEIVDTRINNVSQLAGFAKASDLKYFAKQIADISYSHNLDFAPTKELLGKYRDKKISWEEYEKAYLNLLDMRKIAAEINIDKLHNNCLLCSEHTPERCHRRLLAEYLARVKNDIKIVHLID